MMRFLDETPPAQWPTWIVLPKSAWDRTRPQTRALLDVIGEPVRGIDYAGKIDGSRVVDVVVVKKKTSATTRPVLLQTQ